MENVSRGLILFSGDIVDRVSQIFILVNCPIVQHGIVIEVASSSCGEGIVVTGEGDVIAFAPFGLQFYIQFAECICVCLIGCEIDLLCSENCAETNYSLSLF